ncbi:hypothetical protein B0H19DRAFT_1299293, partial [Mycena capillaripes]
MVQTARKYHLEFTALSVSREIQLQMPMWNHLALVQSRFDKVRRKDAARCLLKNHRVRTVGDTVCIAGRITTLQRQPHSINPSGIGRKNCGCPLCRRDRVEYGCENPGECIETAKMLVDCIHPKWNPTVEIGDLCDQLALSDEEKSRNRTCDNCQETELTFDPN